MQLSHATLDRLDERIAVPTYDRHSLARSIVHIGVGGFHRAHLAGYIDELATAGSDEWSIVGAGVLAGDAAMADALLAQDCLYTLVTRTEDEADLRVVGSIVDYIHAYPDAEPLVEQIADPATRIVSLTVTEGGYPVDDESGDFDDSSPNAAPGSAFDAIVRGLRRRRERDAGPLTILSCDNIIGNGSVARTSTIGVAGRSDLALSDWISSQVAFPNSMVDRITPVTTDRDRRWLLDEFGVHDRWPVMTEPFRQWVVEDRFAAGRPPFEDLGVIITDDVEPYELFKLRLLNAGHSCLAYLARLVEIELVDEALADERLRWFVRAFLDNEAGPMVPHAPGIDLEDYKASLISRFSNPAIGDQIDRLCLDGSAKFPKFLLPTVRGQIQTGGPVGLAALALAGWCQYLLGSAESGTPIEAASDPRLTEAQEYAARSLKDPAEFLRFRTVFGEDLPTNDRFVSAFSDALLSLRADGVRSTLDSLMR